MSKLWLVPTPIGNLEDMTFRAIRILKEADLVLVEDSRVSGKLLKHYEITTPMLAFHQHNEHQLLNKVIAKLQSGLRLALITDAGTPGISDPGFLLVRACYKHHIEVETLPGPTAFVPALVNSGLPCDTFVFEGFLPAKKGRQTKFESLTEESKTMVFYESPHRLVKTLKQFIEYLGADRIASVSRELSKIYEENIRGTLTELVDYFESKAVKGELVIVVAGKNVKKPKDGKK